ncbi:MAG: IS1595 family transposase, partial [Patescibacteria group bacterium]
MAKKQDKYGSPQLKLQFPNDDACLEAIFDAVHVRACSCGGTYKRLPGRLQFHCSKCAVQISPLVGTIFQKTHIPLRLWFQALVMFSNAKSGLSSKYLEREINVNYKTAWRMLTVIRKALKQGGHRLKGDVEMDEGYFGGKGYGGKNNELLGVAMSKKAPVVAAIERGGVMKAEVTPNVTAQTIGGFLNKNIEPNGTRLLTDQSNRYDRVAKHYNRQSVDHGRKEYVRGDVHVNNVESFWAHIKRSIKGTHKAVSKKYLQSYLDGFVWHRNNRYSDKARFEALLGILI